MNKLKVDQMIPAAYTILPECGIVQNGEVENGYRGQIAAFGASIAMGSLLSSIAFFSKQGNSDVDRNKLMQAIFKLVAPNEKQGQLFDYALKHKEPEFQENVLCAAVALKLAMNLYKRIENQKDTLSEGASV